MTPSPAPDPAYLWQVLRVYIEQLCISFGLPTAIARLIWMTRAQHKHLCDWLRPLEALLRRLIFLDAIALIAALPPIPEAKTRAKRAMPAAFGAAFDIDNSETWRARFNINSANMDRRRPRRHAPTKANLMNGVAAAPVATRVEALIRAFNNRENLACALARKLQRDAAHAQFYLKAPAPRDARKPLWPPVTDATRLCRQLIFGDHEAIADTS